MDDAQGADKVLLFINVKTARCLPDIVETALSMATEGQGADSPCATCIYHLRREESNLQRGTAAGTWIPSSVTIIINNLIAGVCVCVCDTCSSR